MIAQIYGQSFYLLPKNETKHSKTKNPLGKIINKEQNSLFYLFP